MSRAPFVPLPADISRHDKSWVTPSQAADYLGEKVGTIRKWCRNGDIVAHRRSPRGDQRKGDWAIPIATLQLLERRLGLTVKRSA